MRRSKKLRDQGLDFEKRFADWAATHWDKVYHGMWLRDGRGAIQPDVVVVLEDKVICFECKRTYKPIAAKRKLKERYIPALEKHFRMPTYGVQVIQKLGPRGRRAVGNHKLIFDVADLDVGPALPYCVWLWK